MRGGGRPSGDGRDGEVDKLRKALEREREKNTRKDAELAKKDADHEAALAASVEAAGSMEVDSGAERDKAREELGKQREIVALAEKFHKLSPTTTTAAALAEAQASLQVLQGKVVEGRSLDENLRITDLNILRREKAVARITEEGSELQERIGEMQAKMAKLQAEYVAKQSELDRDKADRARLLKQKASEAAAAATLPAEAAATGAPAVVVTLPPSPQLLFDAVAALPGFDAADLQAMRGIWDKLRLQALPAVPSSPTLTASAPPAAGAGPVEPPAGEIALAADGGSQGGVATAVVPPAPNPAGDGAAAGSEGPGLSAQGTAAIADATMDASENGGKCKGFLEAIAEQRAAKKGRTKQ